MRLIYFLSVVIHILMEAQSDILLLLAETKDVLSKTTSSGRENTASFKPKSAERKQIHVFIL